MVEQVACYKLVAQTPTPPDARSRELEAKVDRMAERLERAIAAIESSQGPDRLERDAMQKLAEARLDELMLENAELKKRIEELLAKKDGN